MAPDMWSGWGIRTLSAEHACYNPYSYQNGSVWPHDNGIIALGLRRYGFTAEAARVARDLSEAASHFGQNRMPELYAGLQRTPSGFPVQYVGANVPQAWAAGSVFMTMQAMLGLEPDAPNGVLRVDPALPPWLPDLTLTGGGAATLRVRPLLSGRSYHAQHHENPAFGFDPVDRRPETVTWQPYPGLPAISAHGGSYRHDPVWYRRFLYSEEQARGMACEEDLASPGILSFDLAADDATLALRADRGPARPVADLAVQERRRRDAVTMIS